MPFVAVDARGASNSQLWSLYQCIFRALLPVLPRVALIQSRPDGSVSSLSIRALGAPTPNFCRLHRSLPTFMELGVGLRNIRYNCRWCVNPVRGNCGLGPLPALRYLSVDGFSRRIPELYLPFWAVPSLERFSLCNRYDSIRLSIGDLFLYPFFLHLSAPSHYALSFLRTGVHRQYLRRSSDWDHFNPRSIVNRHPNQNLLRLLRRRLLVHRLPLCDNALELPDIEEVDEVD